ncbi:glycosyltransferase [Fibrobacter sp. UWH4]|uniref:glycosyltransferase n=1 Tax=Fibrobacter sp. UWH4 TaxID=1896210 RepID=UPI000934B858|nr:glycosyltransferase [Fibrobacter sp. UWH4]
MNVILMTGEGYPKRFSANNSKSEFIARGLKECGCSVSIIDGAFGAYDIREEMSGISENGIDYCIFPRTNRLKSFFVNLPKLWKTLKNKKRKGEVNHIIIGMEMVPFIYVYFAMAWLQGYSRSCLFHEWHAGLSQGFVSKIRGCLLDYTFGYFVNAIFPIGHFLREKCNRFHKPNMLIPILADFDVKYQRQKIASHFTYCCAGEYLLRNTLVLDSFRELHKQEKYRDVQLVLVIQGNDRVLKKTQELVQSYADNENIIVKNKVPRQELDEIFASSIGLLIPLDPNSLQDKARFSQKIAEYVATRRPIITSAVGEIPFYFKDRESAILAKYDVAGYCEAMRFLVDNRSRADEIGENGFSVGQSSFDYREYGKKIKAIIEKINE